MTRSAKRPFIALLALGLAAHALAAPGGEKGYSQDQASGNDVIAFWNFDGEDGKKDASGNGFDLSLLGKTRIEPKGKFGACLECFPSGAQLEDEPQGAQVEKNDALSPQGPFTVEMWISPRDDAMQRRVMMLFDNKYYFYPKDLPRANTGICIFMQKRLDKWQLIASLGFGQDSARYETQLVELEANLWRHIAFTYDGAGTGVWHLDGEEIARANHEGRGPITPAKYPLKIGERVGSTHAGFAGYLDEVRFSKTVRTFEP